MKKSLRILSLILAVVMMMGSLSVLGSAYSVGSASGKSAYKGNDVLNTLEFDDVNKPVYTLDQYATMALDEIDRMLVDAELGVIDVYVGTLELESVDGTVTSVAALISGVKDLATSGLLGDGSYLVTAAKALTESKWSATGATGAAAYTKRANGDITVLWDLLDLIGGIDQIVYNYVTGDITVGLLDGLIGAYLFNVKELIFGALLGVTGMADTVDAQGNKVKYDYFDTFELPDDRYKGDGASMRFLQDVINNLVLGEWKQLDNLFYDKNTNPNSAVVFSEFMFRDGSANGALVTDTEPNPDYDYYGWVHPEEWVTFGLGDAIRVRKGTVPAASYSKLDVANLPNTYDFIEPLLLQAYNGIAVPVLNRITASWLREEMGFVFESRYTEKWKKDVKLEDGSYLYPQTQWYDENGDKVRNPEYDYFYMGSQPEGAEIDYSGSGVYKLFDPENLHIPYAELGSYSTFIDALNHNAGRFVNAILDAESVTNGAVTTYTWTDPSDDSISYTFTWTDGSNDELVGNICNLLKFVLKVTGDEFFDKYAVERGEIKSAAELDAMESNQELLAYIIREVINSSVDYMYMDEDEDTVSIAGAGLEAVIQLAAQDLPGIDYRQNMPTRKQENNFGGKYYADFDAYTDACIDKALAILMDVAAFKLNCELDTEFYTVSDDGDEYVATNSGSKDNTGLLSIQGNNGVYGTNVGALIAWAISYWASKPERNTSTGAQNTSNYVSLLNVRYNGQNTDGSSSFAGFLADDQAGAYNGFNEDTFWNDLDALLNAIIPIRADNVRTQDPNDSPWISDEIASKPIVSKAFILDYLVKPIVNLDFDNIYEIFSRNTSGAFASDTLETIIIDLLNRVFDLLFPDVFKRVNADTIDDVLDPQNLAEMAADLIVTLSATKSKVSDDLRNTANGGKITGRGMLIADVALPIVCLVLGLHDDQDFEPLENMIPEVITTEGGETSFQIYNGSSGVNTSYRDVNGERHVDHLYAFRIRKFSASAIAGTGLNTDEETGKLIPKQLTLSGLVNNKTTISGGEFFTVKLSGGYMAGQTIEISIEYDVLDENGNPLGTPLTCTAYTYVASGTGDNAGKGDDEIAVAHSFAGKVITAPDNLYITGGLSSLENFTFRIKDDDANKNVENPSESTFDTISVTSVNITGGDRSWASVVTFDEAKANAGDAVEKANRAKVKQTLTSQGGTFVYTPFVVDDNANRWAYEYKKDTDGNYILDKYGLKRRLGLAALEAGEYYVPDGDYVANVTFASSKTGSTLVIPVHVHIYNDFGLPGLVDSEMAANRSVNNLTSVGQGQWTNYKAALVSGIGLTLPPHTTGNVSGGSTYYASIQSSKTVNAAEEETNLNIYEEYYKTLYSLANSIKKEELSSGAQSIWEKVNTYRPYNYTRVSYKVGDTTCWYKDGLEYYENGYQFVATCNYVSHTFTPFRKAINHANDLIDREYKYIAASQEDFNKYDANTQATLLNAYKQAEASKGVISSVESAYAIHMLDLTAARLIPVEGDKSKLTWAFGKFANKDVASFSTESAAAYNNAKTFASDILAKEGANPDEINTAMNELIIAYKELIGCADITGLNSAFTAGKNFIAGLAGTSYARQIFNGTKVNTVIGAANTPVSTLIAAYQKTLGEDMPFTAASIDAYMAKLSEANDIINNANNGIKLGKDQQGKIDALAALLNATNPEMEGSILVAAEIDDPDEPGEGGDGSDIEFIEGVEYDCGDDVVEAWLDTDILEIFDCGESDEMYLGYVECDDGEFYVEGVIYGLYDGFDESIVDELFDYDEDSYFYDYVNLNEEDSFSSGTVVSFYSVDDEDEEEPLRSFLVAYRGELNGDGYVDSFDTTMAKYCDMGVDGYDYSNPEAYEWVIGPSMDADGCYDFDSYDVSLIRSVDKLGAVINQAEGELM